MKTAGPHNPQTLHAAVPRQAPPVERSRQRAGVRSDLQMPDAPHSPLDASSSPATPVPALPSRRGLPLAAAATPLRVQSLEKLRAGVAKRQRHSVADHAWALFATLPSELSAEVPLHAAAYLQRLVAATPAESAPGAPYQGALDFMACVVLANQVASGRTPGAKQRDWLVTFRTALELHRSALGYDAPLPAIDAPFVFAALESAGRRLGWDFKLPEATRQHAARVLRAQTEATAALTRLWDFADLNQPHEETFRKLLWQCLVP